MGRAFFLLCALGAIASCATATVPFDDDAGANPMMDAPAPCTTMCSGACSDPKTDNANCGKCGNACPMTATCVQGSCQCPMASPNRCAATCVDFKTDNTHSGNCNTLCGQDAGAIMGGGTWG